MNNESGIYFLTREDENGFKFNYTGQAKHILDRLCQHMVEHKQHIDNSLSKHKLYDEEENPYGWEVEAINYPVDELNAQEQYWIKEYAKRGYQLLNKTSGSQGQGKTQIAEYTPRKGYRDGVEQGKKQSSKEISHLFDLHLNYSTKKDPPTVNQIKALQKFEDFLNFYKEDREDNGED